MRQGHLVLCLLLWWCVGTVGWAQTRTIREVVVRSFDGSPIDPSLVLNHILSKPNTPFDQEIINGDVRRLHESGIFSRVNVRVKSVGQDLTVIFEVELQRRIRRLEITGADYLGNKKVRETIGLGVGDLIDEGKLALGARKLRDEYAKHFFPHAKVVWEIIPLPEPGLADLKITVIEGNRAGVRKIIFHGNRNVRTRTLRSQMTQTTVNWLSWLTRKGGYDPDELAWDIETLRRVYQEHGYLDAKVSEPVVKSVRRNKVDIVIEIEEGPLYRISSIDLEGVTIFEVPQLLQVLPIRTGDVASISKIEDGAKALEDYYGDRGYYGTRVEFHLIPSAEGGTVGLRYVITERERAYIRDIRITGNTVTRDKVIRRELTLRPGDVLSAPRLRRAQNRLINTHYFESVDVLPIPVENTNEYDVVISVEEGRTGQFLASVGYSSVDEFVGSLTLQQGNFDLFSPQTYFRGGGQKLALRAAGGPRIKEFDIYFKEPWFLYRQLELDLALFQRDRDIRNAPYNEKRKGGNVSLGWPITTKDRLAIGYGLESITIYDVSERAPNTIQEEQGTRSKSEVGLRITRDTRDRPFVPTKGHRTSLGGAVAGGPLQGDTQIYSIYSESSSYWPLWFEHVFSVRGRIGVVDTYGDADRVPLFERFFLGGMNDLRGFRVRDVGPRDPESGTRIGGQSVFHVTAEYSIPIFKYVRWAFFYDTGMVWLEPYEFDFENLNSDWGLGIRFDWPQFPIQFNYAWPIETDGYNDRAGGRFSFSIGYTY